MYNIISYILYYKCNSIKYYQFFYYNYYYLFYIVYLNKLQMNNLLSYVNNLKISFIHHRYMLFQIAQINFWTYLKRSCVLFQFLVIGGCYIILAITSALNSIFELEKKKIFYWLVYDFCGHFVYTVSFVKREHQRLHWMIDEIDIWYEYSTDFTWKK